MTTQPPPILAVSTAEQRPAALWAGISGDLDFETADELLETVGGLIDTHPGARDLHLDCAGLGVCDTMGLSVLIMVRRRTAAAGIALHLDHRGPALERLLDLTGTLEHLTGALPPAGRTPA